MQKLYLVGLTYRQLLSPVSQETVSASGCWSSSGLHFSQGVSWMVLKILASQILWELLEPSGKYISLRNVILKIPMEYKKILDLRVADPEYKKLSRGKVQRLQHKIPKTSCLS